MNDLEQELIAHAHAAREALDRYNAEIKHVRELLPRYRVANPGVTVVTIEEKIERVYDRGTISRLTAKAAGRSRKPREDS